MRRADEYRAQAERAESHARELDDVEVKRATLEIARQWRQLADQAERELEIRRAEERAVVRDHFRLALGEIRTRARGYPSSDCFASAVPAKEECEFPERGNEDQELL